MIRFRLAGVSVQIHLSHLLICGLVAWSFVGWVPARTSWPREALVDLQHPDHRSTLAIVWLSWVVMLSGMVISTSFAQAFVSRRFGVTPELHVIGLGGKTALRPGERLEWWQEVLSILSGPSFALGVSVLSGLVLLVSPRWLPQSAQYFSTGLFFGGLLFAGLNLLPATGLGGGMIASLVLTRFFGRAGYIAAQLLALGLVGVLMLFAIVARQPMLAILVAFMSMRSVINVLAAMRGVLPGVEAPGPHPLEALVTRAEALYRERRLSEARNLADRVADTEGVPPALRSRAHLLLGWVALKEGSGRAALDQFSQVQGIAVPAHALAAAFSLIGDETRAVPLWARAAQENPDPVIRHELAGALIRAGRDEEARQIPGIDVARAYSAAERVLYVRGEYERAARVAETAFAATPSAELAYTAACAWALAEQPTQAMRMLVEAATHGFKNATEAREDPDLRSLRGSSAFQQWLASLS